MQGQGCHVIPGNCESPFRSDGGLSKHLPSQLEKRLVFRSCSPRTCLFPLIPLQVVLLGRVEHKLMSSFSNDQQVLRVGDQRQRVTFIPQGFSPKLLDNSTGNIRDPWAQRRASGKSSPSLFPSHTTSASGLEGSCFYQDDYQGAHSEG